MPSNPQEGPAVLAYATANDRQGPPRPPLHFWMRLVLFALIAGAFALPLMMKAWSGT